MSPLPSRSSLVVLLASIGSLVAPVVAGGEIVPSQAVADRGMWLPFAPAPPLPGGICMIDSGAELNPDTQPEVIAREALDGGDPGDVSPIKHGTLMAMEAAAPANNWGMIGAAPTAVRVVSIRAESTTDALTIGAYKQAIVACQDLSQRHPEYNLKVISMSIGFQSAPQPEQLLELEDAAKAALSAGLNLLAAAGDESSQAISYPAAVPPILAVGASGASRAQCSFSNGGTVVLLAPGCDLEETNPVTGASLDEYAGTSQATAITAAVLAALRAYEPQLGPLQAEQLLTSTARSAGGSLDVTSLFQSAGLNRVVEAGQRNEPPLTATPPVPPRTVPPARLSRPRVSIHRQRSTLIVRFLNLPAGSKAILRVLSPLRHNHRVELARMATRHRTVRLQARANALLSMSYEPLAANGARISPTKVISL
jgi:hypothetical protein